MLKTMKEYFYIPTLVDNRELSNTVTEVLQDFLVNVIYIEYTVSIQDLAGCLKNHNLHPKRVFIFNSYML